MPLPDGSAHAREATIPPAASVPVREPTQPPPDPRLREAPGLLTGLAIVQALLAVAVAYQAYAPADAPSLTEILVTRPWAMGLPREVTRLSEIVFAIVPWLLGGAVVALQNLILARTDPAYAYKPADAITMLWFPGYNTVGSWRLVRVLGAVLRRRNRPALARTVEIAVALGVILTVLFFGTAVFLAGARTNLATSPILDALRRLTAVDVLVLVVVQFLGLREAVASAQRRSRMPVTVVKTVAATPCPSCKRGTLRGKPGSLGELSCTSCGDCLLPPAAVRTLLDEFLFMSQDALTKLAMAEGPSEFACVTCGAPTPGVLLAGAEVLLCLHCPTIWISEKDLYVLTKRRHGQAKEPEKTAPIPLSLDLPESPEEDLHVVSHNDPSSAPSPGMLKAVVPALTEFTPGPDVYNPFEPAPGETTRPPRNVTRPPGETTRPPVSLGGQRSRPPGATSRPGSGPASRPGGPKTEPPSTKAPATDPPPQALSYVLGGMLIFIGGPQVVSLLGASCPSEHEAYWNREKDGIVAVGCLSSTDTSSLPVVPRGNGLITGWNLAGFRSYTQQFRRSAPNGERLEFSPHGLVLAKGLARPEGKIEKWEYWDEGGNLTGVDEYKSPNIGTRRLLWPNGEVQRTGPVKGDNPEGLWLQYDETGKLLGCETYEDGTLANHDCPAKLAGEIGHPMPVAQESASATPVVPIVPVDPRAVLFGGRPAAWWGTRLSQLRADPTDDGQRLYVATRERAELNGLTVADAPDGGLAAVPGVVAVAPALAEGK
jgi:hypothetical protein